MDHTAWRRTTSRNRSCKTSINTEKRGRIRADVHFVDHGSDWSGGVYLATLLKEIVHGFGRVKDDNWIAKDVNVYDIAWTTLHTIIAH